MLSRCLGWRVPLFIVACALAAGTGGCNSSGERGRETAAPSEIMSENLVLAGEAAAARGDRNAALNQFARAIEINPRFVRAHIGMGEVYRVEGNYTKAEASYRTAAQLEPTNFEAQYFHGLMLHVLNRVSESVAAYLRALALRPNDFQANLNLATAYYQLSEHRQAVPYAESAVRLSPRSGPARLNLGAIYAALGRDREALAEYQQASEYMELTPALMNNLAESYGKLGRYEEMRNTLLELIKKKPSAQAYERLGYASFKLGRAQPTMYAAALANFEKSIDTDPDYYPALNGLGVCMLNLWLESDRRDAAAKDKGLECLRKSIQINGNQPRILELLSRYGR
ncbi:MAG: tetratricopeptide repeat protein [Phycisphaerales bacterium]